MAPPVVEMKTNLTMSPLGVSCAHRLPATRISRKRIQSSGPRCFEYKMESAKRKAEPTTLENNEALPRKRARTQIYRTAYTTQWPCIVPASNGSSCYAHCTFCDEDLVMAVEMTFADMSNQINVRLTGSTAKKNSPSRSSLPLLRRHSLPMGGQLL